MIAANRGDVAKRVTQGLLLCVCAATLTALGRWLLPVATLGLSFPLEGPFLAIVLARYGWRGLLLPALAVALVHALAPAGQLGAARIAALAALNLLTAIGAGLLLPRVVRRRSFESLNDLTRLAAGLLPVLLLYSVALWAVLGPVNDHAWPVPLLQTVIAASLGITSGIAWHCFLGLPAAYWRFRIRPMAVPLLLLIAASAAAFRMSYLNALEQKQIELDHGAQLAAVQMSDWLRAERKIVTDLRALFNTMPLVAPGVLESFADDFDPAARRQVIWLASSSEAGRFETPLMAPAAPALDIAADEVLRQTLDEAVQLDQPSIAARRLSRDGREIAELSVWAPVVDHIEGRRRVTGLVGLRVELEPALAAMGTGPLWSDKSVFVRLPGSVRWWTHAPRPGGERGEATIQIGALKFPLTVQRDELASGIDGFLPAIAILLAGLLVATAATFVMSQETGRQLAKRREAKRLLRIDRQLGRFRENLQESQKLASLGAMVAGITHEVNTPLCTAKLGAENLRYALGDWRREGMPPDESLADEMARTIGSIENNLQRAADLMNEFKRVSADRSSDRPRAIDLRDYLRQILDLMAPRLKDRRQRVVLVCAPGVHIVTVAGALSQAIIILLENALVHGYPNNEAGTIRIECTAHGGGIRLLLSDDGVGIPAEVRDHVFKQFFTSKADSFGTGLGLYLARNLIQSQLGGQLRLLDSEAGACFEIRIERRR